MSNRSVFFQKKLPIGATVQVKMKNGAEFHGVVLEHEEEFLLMQATNGEELFIDYNDISSGSIRKSENSAPLVRSTANISEPLQSEAYEVAPASINGNGNGAARTAQKAPQEQLPSLSVVIAPPTPAEPIAPQIVTRLMEIHSTFYEHTQSAHIELHSLEFKLPAHELPKEAHSDWVKLKNRYDYARKIHDEDKRLPLIIQDLKDLAKHYPSAPTLKSQLVQFLISVNKLSEALLYSMQAAVTSEAAADWHNLAALALSIPERDEMLACIALSRLFRRDTLHNHLEAWYLYISLLQKTHESWLLYELREKKQQLLVAEEERLLLDTMFYLLLSNKQDQEVQKLLGQQLTGTPLGTLLQAASPYFKGRPSNLYYDAENELDTCLSQIQIAAMSSTKSTILSIPPLESISAKGAKPTTTKPATPAPNSAPKNNSTAKTSPFPQGRIYTYKAREERGYLFDAHGKIYFFPRGAVKSYELLTHLEKMGEMLPEEIQVYFESGAGPSGPLDDTNDPQAVRVWLAPGIMPTALKQVHDNISQARGNYNGSSENRVVYTSETPSPSLPSSLPATNGSTLSQAEMQTIDNIFAEAKRLGEEQKYSPAIVHIKRLLQVDPDYPGAKEYHTWLREQASLADLPSGPNPYAVAKRALQSKDLERAEDYFRQAIRQNDRKESAIKDLATLLMRVNRNQEAIDLLKRYQRHMRERDQSSVDSLLIQLYQRDNQFEPALELMLKRYQKAYRNVERAHQSWSIANMYLRQNEYTQAQQWFQRVIDQRIDGRMVTAQISVALCLTKLQQYEQAEELLNQIVVQDVPTEVQEQISTLFHELHLLKSMGGDSARIDELINMTYNSDFSVGISRFANFFLKLCTYEGIDSSRIEDQPLGRGEVNRLKAVADRVGVQNPHERSDLYLTAAKIMHELEDFDDQNDLYLYLCRSFTSRGDAAVKQGQLEVVRELYSEALHLYDADLSGRRDDPDAVCALTRFLYSTLGSIPLIPLDKPPTIDNTLHDVFTYSKDSESLLEKIFDAITYLVSYSQFAANYILQRLYRNADWQEKALSYLSRRYGEILTAELPTRDMFINMWSKPRRQIRDAFRATLVDLQPVISKLEINEASIQNHMEQLSQIEHKVVFELDKRRIGQVRAILESMLSLCYVSAFEDRDRFMSRVDTLCQNLLQEIEASPTRLSVEGLCPIVDAVQRKISILREEIYKTSEPQITVRHALERYTPDDNRNIKVQIVVENKPGCSPADALELVVDAGDDNQFFTPPASEIRSAGSLRGGQQNILNVPIQVSELALSAQTFSLPIHVQYRTLSSSDTPLRVQQSFAIRLYTSTEFAHIDNPYAAYAKGHVVENKAMFYGRTELINNVYHAIYNGRSQNKSLIIFGQKRSGKSSILHHLANKLKQTPELLVVNIGNIGMLIDEHSSVELLYQILWGILSKLRYELEDDYNMHERAQLDLHIPEGLKEFINDPSPLVLFKEIFERFKRLTAHTPGWEHTHVVLLIDEFSYVYGKIMDGKLSANFMINWKALLQYNFFSAVLVAQDVVPKFKERFPNEFGFIEDIRVNYLEVEDAMRLIDEPIRIEVQQGQQSRYREKAKETILELTAGSPYYIQIICNQLVNYMNNQHAELVTAADVAHVKQMLIEGSNSLEWPDFDNLVNSGDNSPDAMKDPDVKKVLIAIAKNSRNNGRCSLNNVLSSAEKTEVPVETILADLVARKVVDRKEEQYYSIRVGLFREWLNARQ